MRKDDQGDGNPALPANGQVAIPTRRDGNGDGRACQTGETSANKGIQVAGSVDVDAQGVCRSWIFADGTQVQAGFGAVDIVPSKRHEQVAKIDQEILVGKHDRAKVGNLREQGDGHTGNDRTGNAGETITKNERQAGAQKRKRETADGLISLEVNDDNSMSQAEDATSDRSSQEPEPDVAGLDSNFKTSHRAEQHHAFDAKILDAGTLSKDLADGGDKQNSTGAKPGAENFEPVHQACSSWG